MSKKDLNAVVADLIEQSHLLGRRCEGMRRDEYAYPAVEFIDLVLAYAHAIKEAERTLACRAGRLAMVVKNLSAEEIIALAHEFREKHPGDPPPIP